MKTNILKNKILWIVLILAIGFNLKISLNSRYNKSDVHIINLEALSNESNGSLTRGYKPVQKKIIEYGSYQSTIWGGFWYYNYIYINCCESATQMEFCDFTMQDSRC
ncbi:MAG: hypothetical protein LBG15_04985 [Dysgonamonadaceae bacterium]|jgi:hypothetical protein|nr:hypothetical protein [Dysgonamonadaceae bacterium]